MKLYINGMSLSKSDIGDKLEQGVEKLIEHLIKLYLYPNNVSVNHWRTEVAEKLYKVDSLKHSYKYPDPEFILKHTLQVHKKRIPYLVQCIIDDYGLPEFIYDISVLTKKIELYFHWLANELSVYGRLSFKNIQNKLEQIGF